MAGILEQAQQVRKNRNMKNGVAAGILIWIAALANGQTKIEISGMVEWERMELNAVVTLDLASAGIKFPTGRLQAEEIINVEYANLMQPHILAIPIDSSSNIEDLINRNELSLRFPFSIAAAARKVSPVLSTDLTHLTASYTIDLTAVNAQIIRHSQARELPRPLIPVPSADYTGLIIIANENLPVHGRNITALAEPCIFPKVWDTDMNLFYERNVLDPAAAERTSMVRYVSEASIFRPTPSGLSPELTELVGSNPLRIIAREIFGIQPTDPVIDRNDALIILSSEANRRLLREGRVAIVVSEKTLNIPLK
jgi:hypothetical protein